MRHLLGRSTGDAVNRMLATDLIDSLPGDMLTKVDLMSMANSLEVRVPLLDHHVVELAFRIPGPEKLRRGVTKHVLKETFKDLLPPGHTRQPKSGFRDPHQPLAPDGPELSGRPLSVRGADPRSGHL